MQKDQFGEDADTYTLRAGGVHVQRDRRVQLRGTATCMTPGAQVGEKPLVAA